MRTVTNPLEVWEDTSDPEIFFLVLEKRQPTSDNPHEMWTIIISSPDDGVSTQELYAETVDGTSTLVWSESDGTPLPEQYRVELPEDAP